LGDDRTRGAGGKVRGSRVTRFAGIAVTGKPSTTSQRRDASPAPWTQVLLVGAGCAKRSAISRGMHTAKGGSESANCPSRDRVNRHDEPFVVRFVLSLPVEVIVIQLGSFLFVIAFAVIIIGPTRDCL
jgi:hypothetical protein